MTSWSLLGLVLEARDGVRQNEAASRLDVKPPLVTVLTRELIERGYLNQLPHPLDKRAKLLVITPAGKAFVKRVETSISTRLHDLLTGLTDQDLATYQKVLETIIANGNR